MAYLVKMPNLGMEMQEGEVTKWYVETGDTIEERDVIAEIESEKTTREIEARENGTLRSIYMNEGDVGPPGAPMGLVAKPDEDVSDLEAEVDTSSDSDAQSTDGPQSQSSTNATSDTSSPDVKLTPKARKQVSELELDLSKVEGTGFQGSITADDIDRFLKERQEDDGTWFGRWGCNYIYGTWLALAGLDAAGVDLSHPRYQRAGQWIRRNQNRDGGWGETLATYEDPSLKGTGESTASQTAWALMALFALDDYESEAVRAGIHYLLRTQHEDGSWSEEQWTGTGFPEVFYLKYHMYPVYFPILALAEYQEKS